MTTGSASSTVSVRLRAGSTPILLVVNNAAPTASLTSVTLGLTFIVQALAAPGASANVEASIFGNANAGTVQTINQIARPVALPTTTARRRIRADHRT